MLNWIKRFFTAPVFEDEEKTRLAGLLSNMLNVILGAALAAGAVLTLASGQEFTGTTNNLVIIGSLAFVGAILRFLLRRGVVHPISIALSLTMLGIVTFVAFYFGGLQNIVIGGGYLLCIIIAGLLLGRWGAVAFAFLDAIAVAGIWVAEQRNLVKPLLSSTDPIFNLANYLTIFLMGGLLLHYAATSFANALERARRNERAQVEANRALQALRDSLEQQVAERTRDLERRTVYLEASAQVGRAITSILEIEPLLGQVVELIRDRFKLYHVGLFLNDASGQWAEYRAGTGEAGRLLLEQKFRLEIGGQSMIGWCAKNAQARVAQDVRMETSRVSHPSLAESRSEAALPLVVRGRVIGGLSAQSDRPGAFDQDTLAVLQAMADQVAVAIDNARLFANAQEALEAERRAYGEISRQAWASAVRGGLAPGYSYVNKQVVPTRQVEAYGPEHAKQTLTLPITVRGAAIGQVDLHKSAGSQWTKEEAALLQTLIDQLGVALESARLYQDTQRRAAIEQIVNTVTARIRAASPTVNAILQQTTQELGQAFGAARATIQMEITPEANGQEE